MEENLETKIYFHFQGLLDLYKQGNDLLYKLKPKVVEPDQIKNADSEEKVVFDIIKEAGNMGIWIRDIRTQSNLLMTQLNKILKSLEGKKLIKAVKSVSVRQSFIYENSTNSTMLSD